MLRYVSAFALVTLTMLVVSGAAAIGPPAPVNIEVITANEMSITLAWGPSSPGEFTVWNTARKNQLAVVWGASEDSRSPVTYTVWRNGTQVATGLTVNEYVATGINVKVKSFRVCVAAFNAAGQASVQNCGTFTRS